MNNRAKQFHSTQTTRAVAGQGRSSGGQIGKGSAETEWLRSEPKAAASRNRQRFQISAGLNFRRSLNQEELPAVRRGLGTAVAITGKDYRGVLVMAATQPTMRASGLVAARRQVIGDSIMSAS